MRWTWRDMSGVDKQKKKKSIAVQKPAGTSHSPLYRKWGLCTERWRWEIGQWQKPADQDYMLLETDQPDHDSKGHTMCCRYLDIYTSNFQPKSLFLPHLSKGRQKTGEPHLSALVVQTAGRWAFFSRTTVRGCSEEKKQTPKKSKVDIIMFHISLRDPIPFDSHSRGGREGNLTLPMSRNMAYHSHYHSCAWFISTTAHPEQHTSAWGQCK